MAKNVININFDSAFKPVEQVELHMFGKPHRVERDTAGYSLRMTQLARRMAQARHELTAMQQTIAALEKVVGAKELAQLDAGKSDGALLTADKRQAWQQLRQLRDEVQLVEAEVNIEATLGHIIAVAPTLEAHREKLYALPIDQLRWLMDNLGLIPKEAADTEPDAAAEPLTVAAAEGN